MSDHERDNSWVNGLFIVIMAWVAYKVVMRVLVWLGNVFSFVGKVLGVGFAYLGFYLLPFVVVSVVAGWLLFVISGIERLDYRRLLLVQSGMALLAFMLVGFPVNQTREIVTITKTAVVSKKKESPSEKPGKADLPVQKEDRRFEKVVQANQLATTYANFRKQTAEVGEKFLPESYDLVDLSGCVWLALFLGAPLFFYFRSGEQVSAEEKRNEALISEPFESRIEDLETKLDNAERMESDLKQRIKAASEEIEKLKARDAYLTQKEKTPAEPTGVLDSNEI